MATTYVLGSHTELVKLNPTVAPWPNKDRIFVLQNTADFSLHPVTGDTDGIVEMIAVPANCAVLACWYYVHTVDAGVTDMDVGLGEGVEFMETVSGAVAGYVYDNNQSTLTAASLGYIFTAADTIDISIQTTQVADTLKLTLFALCVDLTI
jgi:hypothetical protein